VAQQLNSKGGAGLKASPFRRNARTSDRRAASLNPVWMLNGAMAVGCALLLLGPVRDYDAIADPELPWFLLAALVAATERWPVHLEFRRSAHSFSLTDVPVTLALLF
jgi:hypothetical protein